MAGKYTLNQLLEMLGIGALDTDKASHVFENKGPGYFDTWLSIMENNENSWLQTQSAHKAQAKRRKIIVCSPFLKSQYLPLSKKSSEFFSSLIEHFDVYIWNSKQQISECTPIVSLNTFLETRDTLSSAKESDVTLALSQQGADLNDFIILDYQATISNTELSEILISKSLSTIGDVINLSRVDIANINEVSVLKSGIDFEKIKCINMVCAVLDDLQLVIKYFPNFEKIICNELYDTKSTEIVKLLANKEVELVDSHAETLILDDLMLKALTLKRNARLNTIKVSTSVTKLEIMNCSNLERVLVKQGRSKLLGLSINNCAQLNEIEFNNQAIWNTLQEVSIMYMKEQFIKNCLAHLKRNYCLKQLAMPAYNSLEINLPNCDTLEIIDLGISQLKSFHVKSMSNVKSLSLCPQTDFNIFINLISAIANDLVNLNLYSAMLKENDNGKTLLKKPAIQALLANINFPKLRTLSLKSWGFVSTSMRAFNTVEELQLIETNIEACEWANFKNCKSITIRDSCPVKLDFSDFTALEELTISNCAPLTDIKKPSKKLKIFSVKDCPKLMPANKAIINPHLVITQFDRKALLEASYIEFSEVTDNIFTEIQNHSLPNVTSIFYKECESLKNFNWRLNAECFSNLEILKIDDTTLPEHFQLFDRKLQVLEFVNCDGAKTLDLSMCRDLRFLKIEIFALKTIIFPSNNKIESIIIHAAEKLKLKLEDFHQLRKLNISFIKTVHLNRCHSLSSAKIVGDNIDMDFNSCNLLKTVYLESGVDLKIANIEQATALRSLVINTRSDTNDELENTASVSTSVKNAFATKRNCSMIIFNMENRYNDYNLHDLRMQHLSNEDNAVSIFNYRRKALVDADTKIDIDTYAANGAYKILFYGSDKISRHEYRIDIYDTIVHQNGKLIYTTSCSANYPTKTPGYQIERMVAINIVMPAFDDQKIATLKRKVTDDNNYWLGYFEGPLFHGQLPYMLPTKDAFDANDLTLNDIEFYTNPPNAIKLIYDTKLQTFWMQLNPVLPTNTQVQILYRLKRNLIYNKLFTSDVHFQIPVHDPATLLPKELIDYFLRGLKELPLDHPLSVIWFNEHTVEEKIKLLTQYCKFDSTKELTTKPTDDIATEFAIIVERQGACRHRARSFFLLARLLGVPVCNIENEKHAFSNIPVIVDLHCTFASADFGGAETLDLTPADQRKSKFNDIKFDLSDEMVIDSEELIDEIEPIDVEEDAYYQLIKDIIMQDELASMSTLLAPTIETAPPLLELPTDKDIYKTNAMIARQIKQISPDLFKRGYLYIDKPQDFELFMRPYQIKDGKRIRVDEGPLRKIMKAGGIIVVNWSNFTATEVASYKSIIDEKPTLLGEELGKHVKVIGLVSVNNHLCAATLSRSKRYTMSSLLAKNNNTAEKLEVSSVEKSGNEENVDTVDLFNDPSWRKDLLGCIDLNGISLSLLTGKLLEAIKNGRKLIIYNPPINDKEFDLLLHRLTVEKKLMYNGEFIDVPDTFKFELKVKSNPMTLQNVIIKPCEPQTKIRGIYLGMYNFHECFNLLAIDDKNASAKTSPGYLGAYKEGSDVFYITESISTESWRRLLAHIAENYPDKTFEFQLAPGVSIGEQYHEPAQENLVASNRVYLSNDTEYLTEQLASQYKKDKENVVIIDINSATSYTDLIVEQTAHDGFHCTEKGVLKALQEKKKVILNGEMSPTLYQQLLPILSGAKHIYINGVQTEIKDNLTVVMPLACKRYVSAATVTQYDTNDYINKLSNDDAYYGKLIKQFYTYANALPHRGEGMPAQIDVTFKRFKTMVEKLKQGKLHPHNPIKGVFHYDYLPGTNAYCYLNVMAKYLFAQKMPSNPIKTQEKLKRVIAQYHIHSEIDVRNHIWQILNCYDNQKLQEILIDLSDVSKEAASLGYPFVTDKIFATTIMADIDAASRLPLTEKRHTPDKKQNQLFELISDSNITMLFLKGEPGSGKSTSIRTLKEKNNIALYEGDDDLIRWIKDEGPKTALLLLDEANMATPGTWDFLNGISREGKTIYYKGQTYDLKPHHKIVATGNPESFPGRFYHTILQQTAETILFKQFTDAELSKHILEPQLSNTKEIIPDMLSAFHLIERYCPNFKFSSRDLENLTVRFLYLINCNPKSETKESLQQVLNKAAMIEFSGMIFAADMREKFAHDLAKLLQVEANQIEKPDVRRVTDKFAVSQEKSYIADAIEQDLAIRAAMIKRGMRPTNHFYKTCILLEGEAGAGKSKIFKKMLKREGFSKTGDKYGNNKFYEVTAGTKDARAILKTAFHEGSIVILDEFNLDKNLEKLLNQLLTGVDDEGKEAHNPGFMVLASQNAATYKGREPISLALRNRTHFLYVDDYKDKEIMALAGFYGVKNPEKLVMGANRAFKEFNSGGRMRTIFRAFKFAITEKRKRKADDISNDIPIDKVDVKKAADNQCKFDK